MPSFDMEHPSFCQISYLTSGEAPKLPYQVFMCQLHHFNFPQQDSFLLRKLPFYIATLQLGPR